MNKCFEKIGLCDDNYIILDTETTGYSGSDEVIEIGIIDSDGNVLYDSLLNPGHDIKTMITRITGIKNPDLYKAPSIKTEWEKIKKIISGKQIIGHNINFDIRLIQQTLNLHNIDCDIKNLFEEMIDTKKIAKMMLNVASYAQEDLAKALNVKLYPAHRAVNDCLTLLEILNTLNSADSSTILEAEKRMEEVLKEKDPKYQREKRRYELKQSRLKDVMTLHKQGKTVNEIAVELNKSLDTIQSYIIDFVTIGDVDYREFLSFDKEQLIISAIEEMGGYNGRLTSIKQYLGEKVSFLEINLAINKNNIPIVQNNLVEEKLSLTSLAKKNNIDRNDLLNFLISNGLILDISTITKKGEEYGIEYMFGDNGSKWPVYGSEVQDMIEANDFNLI